MEAILVESLMVLVGGTVLGLLMLQSWIGFKRFKPNSTLRIRPVILGRARVKPRQVSRSWPRRNTPDTPKLRSRRSRTKKLVPLSLGPALSQSPPMSSGLYISPETIQACPSCGLQAPGQVIAEHFLGSPLHRDGKARATVEEDETPWERQVKDPDPAASALLRSLVRLLVPPRAFGLRSQEKTVNPLEGLVKRSSLLENISIGLRPVA